MRRCWPAGAHASSGRARTWGGPAPGVVARRHAGGVSLALAAPVDQLFVATEVNEWALCATLAAADPACTGALEAALLAEVLEDAAEGVPVLPPVLEERAALARLAELAAREARPALGRCSAPPRRARCRTCSTTTRSRWGAGSGGGDFPSPRCRRPPRCRGASCTTCRPPS